MNSKLSGVIQIVMLYVSFMGPFVLKNERNRRDPSRVSGARNLGKTAGTIAEVVLIIAAIAFLVIGIILLVAENPIGFLYIIGFAATLTFGPDIIDSLNKWRLSRRSLSKLEGRKFTEPEKLKVLDKMRKYERRFEERFQLGKKFEIAGKETWATKAIRAMKRYKLKRDTTSPGMTEDQVKIEMRDLFDNEFDDLALMNKEMASFSTMSDVEAWHGPQKIRRQYWKLRVIKSINFVQQTFHDQKLWENSFERKYKAHKDEVDKLNAEMADKKTTEERKKAIQKEITHALNRDEEGVSEEYMMAKDIARVSKYYDLAGMNDTIQRTDFFFSFRRAALATLLKIEKIKNARRLVDTPLTPEQVEATNNANAEIDKKIKELEFGNDLN